MFFPIVQETGLQEVKLLIQGQRISNGVLPQVADPKTIVLSDILPGPPALEFSSHPYFSDDASPQIVLL